MVDRTQGMSIQLNPRKPVTDTTSIDINLPELKPSTENINPVTGLPFVEFNNAQLGTGSPELEEPDLPVERTPVSMASSFAAGVGSAGREYFRGAQEKYLFDADPTYKIDNDLANFTKNHDLRDGELDQLKRARSTEQFNFIKDTILDQRDRAERVQDNFWSGLAGSMVDIDIAASLIGGGLGTAVTAAGKVSKVGRAAIGATTAAGTMGAVVAGTEGYTNRTDTDKIIDVVSAGLGGAFPIGKPKPTVQPATPDLDNAIDAERASVSVFDAPDAKVQTNTGKGTTRVLTGNIEAKFRSTDSTLTLESLKTGSKADDFVVRLDAHRYGVRTAESQGLQYHINPQETRVIKALQSEGYNIQGGTTNGTKQINFGGSYNAQSSTTQSTQQVGSVGGVAVVPVSGMANYLQGMGTAFADAAVKNVAERLAKGEDIRYTKAGSISAAKANPNYNVVDNADGTVSVIGVRDNSGVWFGVAGTSKVTNRTITSVSTTVPARVLATPASIQRASNEVLEDVLKVDDEVASIPLDNVPDTPVGARIPLSRTLYDADGNELMPKGSMEREWQAQIQSAWDLALHYTQDINHPFMKLLASQYSLGDNAPALARTLESRGDVRLAEFERDLDIAAKEIYGTNSWLGRFGSKSHANSIRQVGMDVYEQMQRLDQFVLEQAAKDITMTDAEILARVDALDVHDGVKRAMKTYIESGFATTKYDELARSGVVTEDMLELITRRSTYMPVAHSYTRTRLFINDAGDAAAVAAREQSVRLFLGKQIADMYPSLRAGITTSKGVIRMTPESLGKRFMDNAKARESSPSAVRTTGVPKDDLVDMMVDQGVELEEATQLAVKISDQRSAASGFSNTRRRISWDWNAKMTAPDGTTFGMRDLVDENPMGTLNEYNRRVSKRSALATYGFKDRTSLDKAKQEILDKLPKGTDHAKAVKFMDDTISAAMGNPVGDSIPATLRSMQTFASSILLAWSGLYQVVEAATQVQKLGLLRSLPAILPAMRPMFKGMGGFTVSEAKDLEKAITGQMMSPDRWRRIFTQYSDDFDVTNSFHEGVQYFGQSTKFLNGSEFIKRYQIGMYASVITRAFEGASKGVASDIKFLQKKLRMSDELIDVVSKEYKAHGDNINAWDADARLAMEQKVLSEGDNLALQILHGEAPDFMDYTAWGKFLFPFMRFVWGAHNKILRGTYIRDGAVGVAMVMAVQFPLAVMVAQLKRASAGEEPYDIDDPADLKELIRSTATAMSALGLFSVPLDIILSEGRNLGSVSVFAPITKTYGLGSAIASEDGASLRDFKENTLLNTPLPLSLLMIGFEEED